MDQQLEWIDRKGRNDCGFSVRELFAAGADQSPVDSLHVSLSQEVMLDGEQRSGNHIRVFSVLYDGILTVIDTDKFRQALDMGIGHGKSLGLGLLSAVPVR